MLADFVHWLVATPVSHFLQNLKNMIPVVQTLHIFAIAAVLSSAAMIDLRVLRLAGKEQSLQSIFRRFEPGVWGGLVVLLITGSLLIIAEPARSLLAIQFQVKVVLILVGIGVTLLLARMMKQLGRDETSPPAARVLAAVSLLVWAAVIAAGRWIAYA
jgi:uncharacterized membrane protein